MTKVYDLHQHTHCVFMYIGKKETSTSIVSNSKRHFDYSYSSERTLDTSIAYNKQRTDVTYVGEDCKKKDKDDIVIDNFHDGLYDLFKKDRETWNEEDYFLMKAVSDYLPLAIKKTVKEKELEIENFDLLHYAFVVPSEWEEEIRDDMIRPIFIKSGLISKEDHEDRLLFYTDIEAICYREYFKRGDNTVLCRMSPEEGKHLIKFDLIQTATTLFDIPNAKLFPKVMKSSSVSVTAGEIERRIKEFLRANLFPVDTKDDDIRKMVKSKLVPSDQSQIIEAMMEGVNSGKFLSLEEDKEKVRKKQPWISFNEEWMLSESQKEFVNSLCPSIICAEIGTFLLGYLKDITSNNFTKTYRLLLTEDDHYPEWNDRLKNDITWVKYILQYNGRSLNHVVDPSVKVVGTNFILDGAGIGVFEAIQHSDIHCKPRIISSEDSSTSSSVFLHSKPDAIINLDISIESTLFTCSILDEDGLVQHIFDNDYFIQDKHLPPLKYFYTFSSTITLNVKEQFITFAERYLLGDLSDLIADDGVSIEQDSLLEVEAILTNNLSGGEVLVSTSNQKYIKAFMLMYMLYIKEAILYKLPAQLVSDQLDMKIGYAVSIETILLNNTVERKDDLRDIIYASGLVPKDDHSKKLRITAQGERILPTIQKSLKLELSLKSYFLLCQLHEDYVQLSLHQVVTAPGSGEKEQESIIVQDEIIVLQNFYDSLCSRMWCNLLQDSSLIELCKMHNTNDNNKLFDLFSLKSKTELFANLKRHISDNILQNNSSTLSTYAVNMTSSCSCKVRLTTSDIIDICFTPVLQDIACTLSASLLNNALFRNYVNIDYLFSFIRFNNNLQLQHRFTRILEEEADDFITELGIDTPCLTVPELFNQLLQPVIAQQPFCYNDFKIGALQQVSSENYVVGFSDGSYIDTQFTYKSKITDTKTIECGHKVTFPFLNKGVDINNVQSNRKFYLRNEMDRAFNAFEIDVWRFETMNYLENTETLSRDNNIHEFVDCGSLFFLHTFEVKDVDVPVMVSVRYVSYTSSFLFFMKIAGADTEDRKLMAVIEIGEPLTLARL